MTTLSPEKIAEILDRHENRSEWVGKEPFYKGMCWPPTKDHKYSGRYSSDWVRSGGSPNLLAVYLPNNSRRSEFDDAKRRNPEFADAVTKLEDALDATFFTFDDDLAFQRGCEVGGTVSSDHIHMLLFAAMAPSDDKRLDRIVNVAMRLESAAAMGLKGVILGHGHGYDRGYGDHYPLVRTADGYSLDSAQQTVVLKETEDRIDTQSQRLQVPGTPSPYGNRLAPLADPQFRFLKSSMDDKSDHIACIIADMVANGETNAIIRLGDRKEFVLADLDNGMSIREIARKVRGVIWNCHQVEIVRAMPVPRPRHRFYVVGGVIVADSTFFHGPTTTGRLSVFECVRFTGPAEWTVSSREDDGEIDAMREFCAANLGTICHARGNWIVDLETSGTDVYLVGLAEICDGEWFEEVTDTVMNALVDHQERNFTAEDLTLSGFGQSSGPKEPERLRKQRIVRGDAGAEMREFEDPLEELLSMVHEDY